MMDKRRIAITVGAVVLVAGVVAGRERPTLELIEARPAAAQVADDGIDLQKLRRGEGALPHTDPFARKNSVSIAQRKRRRRRPRSGKPLHFRSSTSGG